MGALPEPVALGRPGDRVVRPHDQRGVDWRQGRHPAGQRRGLQQEALCAASRCRVAGDRFHRHPDRLGHHLPFASVGRAGVARLVSADTGGGVLRHQRFPTGHHGPRVCGRGRPERAAGPTVGIPSICCPDIETGRVPLPAVAETGYPAANQMLHRGYIQSWNLVVERKLPANFVGSIGYVGSASHNGFAFLDINASQIPGSGDEGRPLFAEFGRTTTTQRVGRPHAQHLPRAAGHHQSAIQRRPSPEGCVHLVEGHRRGPVFRLDGVPLERGERVRPQPRARGPRYSPQLPAWVCVRAPVRQREEVGDERCQQHDPRRLADERRLRRLFGTTVQSDGVRLVTEHAGQPADAGSDQG